MKLTEIKDNYPNNYIRLADYADKVINTNDLEYWLIDDDTEFDLIKSDSDYYDYDLVIREV